MIIGTITWTLLQKSALQRPTCPCMLSESSVPILRRMIATRFARGTALGCAWERKPRHAGGVFCSRFGDFHAKPKTPYGFVQADEACVSQLESSIVPPPFATTLVGFGPDGEPHQLPSADTAYPVVSRS